MKFFKWLIVLAVCFISVAGVISYLWLRHYIYSPHFTSDIVDLGNEKLKGEFDIEGLDPENWGFKAENISLFNSGKIAEIQIKDFQTYFKKWSLLQRTWHMRSIECEELTVHISRKKREVEKVEDKQEEKAWNPHQDEPEEKKVEKKIEKKGKHRPFIHKLAPTDIEFGEIRVAKSNGSVERKKRDISWEGVSLNGNISDKKINLKLSEGTLTIPLKVLPQWKVNEVDVTLKKELFMLHSAEFNHENGGYAKLSGMGDFEGESLSLDSEFYAVPVTSLVKEPNFTTISGKVNGKVKAVNQGDDTLVKGQLFLSDGTITLPKLLKPVLKLLGEGATETITLDQCVGDVKHIGDTTMIENLYMESNELFSVTGRIEIVNDFYRGMCRFGVSEDLYERLPKKLKKNMTENNRFYWVPVRLEGKKEDLVKDISVKLAKSLGGSYVKESDIWDSLQRNVSRIIGDEEIYEPMKGKADKLLDKGLNALEKLFK